MFDRFWWHLDFESFGMSPGSYLGLGEPFCVILNSCFYNFSKSLIFVLETANDRYEDFSMEFY